MRILYITECFPFGKGEAFISSEINQLKSNGHDVLIVPQRVFTELVHKDASVFVPYTFVEKNISIRVLLSSISIIHKYCFIVLKNLFFILTKSKIKNRYRNLQCFLKSLWLSKFIIDQRIEHIHAHWTTCPSSMAMIASDITGISWSFTAHRYDIVENNLLLEKMKSVSFARFISKSGFDLASRLVGEKYIQKGCILHMGVPVPILPYEQTVCTKFVLLCPANFVEVKGHKYLIDAIYLLKQNGIEVELWLAGTGALYQNLVNYVASYELVSSVRFMGQLSHSQLISLYETSQIDAVVLPSIDLGMGHHEGIPVALMEAMSYAIPVISTKTGGIPELVGKNMGILVDDKNAQQLADAINYLLVNMDKRRMLAFNGRQQIIDHYSIITIVKHLECKIYNAAKNNQSNRI